jgi:hypothetical protein
MNGVTFEVAERSAKPPARSRGRWYYVIIEAIDPRTGKRRMLPDGKFVWPVCVRQNAETKTGRQVLADAAQEGRALVRVLNREVWIESASGDRTVIKTNMEAEGIQREIEALGLGGKLADHLWLTGVSDSDLMLLKMRIG